MFTRMFMRMQKKEMTVVDWGKLLFSIVLCEMAGVVGNLFTVDVVPTWYAGLVKPPLNPPSWVFGPVWVTLYAMMGVAAFLVWRRGLKAKGVRRALIAFDVQLVLNAAWSIIFFGAQRPAWAFLDIALLWAAIVWMIWLFYKINKPAAYLLIPYILWVTFASYLNAAIWFLN